MITALFIGRFQPFHKGHLGVIKKILKENNFLIIGIGSAEEGRTPQNPFTAGERWEMITAALDEQKIPRHRYAIIPLRDINNYEKWVEHVERLVPHFDRVYTGSAIVKRLVSKTKKYKIISLKRAPKIEATTIRKLIKEGGAWEKHVPKAVAKWIKNLYSRAI